MTKVLILILCVCSNFYVGHFISLSCKDEYPTNATIQNLKHQVNFKNISQNLNSSSKLNYNLTVTYSWNLKVPTGGKVDGLLYCMKDVDSHSLVLRDDDFTSVLKIPIDNNKETEVYGNQIDYIYGLSENATNFHKSSSKDPDVHLVHCKQYFNQTFWVELDNGTYLPCKFPCSSLLQPTCFPTTVSPVCSKIGEQCRPIPKYLSNLTFPINFGRRYEFILMPYVGHYADTKKEVEIDEVLVYCNKYFVYNLGLPKVEARKICAAEQNISSFSTSGSPPLELNESIAFNYTTNRAVVNITWRKPLDIALDQNVTVYFIKLITPGYQDNEQVPAKSYEEEYRNPYYTSTFVNVPTNQTADVSMSAYVRLEKVCPDEMICNGHSDEVQISFFIKPYNACDSGLNHTSYCDANATCIRLPSNAAKPAECVCPSGYTGNGINPLLVPHGEGCINYNPCDSEKDNPCTPGAICVDEAPPGMGVHSCICRNNLEGDGLKSGSGCYPGMGLVILAIILPLLAIGVFCAMSFVIWKYKLYKKRELDRHFSRFVGSNSSTYITPITVSNGMIYDYSIRNQLRRMEPVFGHKLEVDRSAIVRQGIIGRGNYGVVHKATITINGEESTVAVKSLTGAYTSNRRDDFLAEISLLLTLGSHDNILGVIGVCTVQPAGATDDALSPLLITEYMSYGDLLHFLWDSREASRRELNSIYDFTEVSLYKISRQVAHGLRFLSKQKIIHGDVAARNMLVGKDLQIKISDFGLANDVYRYGMIKEATERRVPFKWVSPERMMGGKTPITWRSDVWSFGILLYEMVTLGAAPYAGMDPMTIFYKLRSGYRMPQPASCSNYLYDLMKDCWQWEATKRPGFKELEEKFSDLLYLQDNENSQNLFTKIQVCDEVNETLYESDIGRRDSITIHMNKDETTFHSQENGLRPQNGSPPVSNGFATSGHNSVESASNGTSSLQRGSNSGSNNVHFLWPGDISVDQNEDALNQMLDYS